MKAENEDIKYYIGIVALAAILVGILFITSMGSSAVVETGDTVQVDYTGKLPDGTVFDTSDPEVAVSAGVYQEGRPYQPLVVGVGAHNVIKGFEDGLLGMKEGESRTLTIPPEDGYGPLDPTKIDVVPQLNDIPATQTFEREIQVPEIQFNMTFGTENDVGDTVTIPDSPINLTIIEIGDIVKLSYDMEVGDRIEGGQTLWSDEVIEVNSTHIVMRHDVEVGDVIQFPESLWNSTVLEVTGTNITLQHNPIPDTTFYITVQTMFGPQQVPAQVHFNETDIILDSNHFLAGKTLTFEVEVVAIEKANTELVSIE
ncbi:MAG: FKBP-type peptidyl-prolyl cis-trans isomerase [ANME-2 cluster archaeon]|nr:FKBP-type peptidyl-prolyl cis-trans isomerase [ANME-2 cluster archaeon]